MVTLEINGERRVFDEDLTVAELLARLDLGTAGAAVAVEINRSIIPRSVHETRRLEDGDRVEIVTFVGGG